MQGSNYSWHCRKCSVYMQNTHADPELIKGICPVCSHALYLTHKSLATVQRELSLSPSEVSTKVPTYVP